MKYFNVFGPFEDHKGDMRSVVAKSYEQIRCTERVKLFKSYKPEFGDGEQRRDFISVRAAVDVTALGMTPKIDFIEMPEPLQGKYQYFTEADVRKLRAAGYTKPFTPLREAVREYVTGYFVPREG